MDNKKKKVELQIILPNFGYLRSCQNVSLVSTEPPLEDLTIFFSQHGVVHVDISRPVFGVLNVFQRYVCHIDNIEGS